MIRTVQALIDADGNVRLIDPIKLDGEHRALVMIMDDASAGIPVLGYDRSLSEWNLPEEDKAWMHLQ